MKYTATIVGWNKDGEPFELQVIDSATYEKQPGNPSDCAFEGARHAVYQYLEKWDNCRIDLHSEAEKEGEQVPEDGHLYYGAFTHPVRGRVMFPGAVTLEGLEATRKEYEEAAAKPIYSPNDLYKMTPSITSYNESYAVVEHYFRDYFPNNCGLHHVDYESIDKERRIQVRHIAHVGLGSDESWTLATLWWNPRASLRAEYVPVAVLTYYGEDYDHVPYITNTAAFGDMLQYIQSFLPKDSQNIVDPDVVGEQFTEFGGHTIHDFYDVKSGLPKRPPSRGKNKFGHQITDWSHYGLWGDDVKYAPESNPCTEIPVESDLSPLRGVRRSAVVPVVSTLKDLRNQLSVGNTVMFDIEKNPNVSPEEVYKVFEEFKAVAYRESGQKSFVVAPSQEEK